MATRKSQLDHDIAESLGIRGRPKIPTYTVQPRNLWRTWDFSTLPDAVAFGLTLGEPFDVSTNSGAIVWGWGQRPPSEAEVWGKKHHQRHPPTKTSHATKSINPEYQRKIAVAGQLADDAWLSGGLDAMHAELKSLYRSDADSVIIGEFERLYHKQMLKVLPEQRLSR